VRSLTVTRRDDFDDLVPKKAVAAAAASARVRSTTSDGELSGRPTRYIVGIGAIFDDFDDDFDDDLRRLRPRPK
jgi:hypothetical protein